MKLLSRFFKKSPAKVVTIEQKIAGLAQQTDAQILSLATATGDDALREAAIAKLSYGEELLGLTKANHNMRIQTAARKRICQLLDNQDLMLAQLAQDIPKQLELIAVVSYSSSATLDVLASISSTLLLIQLASEGNTSQIRQAAAAKISERGALEQLAKIAQNKDKNVYKIVKAKLDIFKAGDAKLVEINIAAQALCAKLERHAKFDADTLFKARLSVLQQEWVALGEELPADTRVRYQLAVGACEAKITARLDEIAGEEEKVFLDQQALELAQAAVENSKTMLADIYSIADVNDFLEISHEHKLQELAQAMRLAANRNLPMDALNKTFEQRKKHVLNLVEQIKASGTLTQLVEQLQLPENTDMAEAIIQKITQLLKPAQVLTAEQRPAIVKTAQEIINKWNSERTELEKATKNSLRELSELTRKGLWSAEQGLVRKARAIQKELHEKRAKIADLPKGMQAKLEDFEQQLAKLGDWHEFAVTPKKEALIVQMQQLIGSAIAPEALATKIHELQDSWKEVSKGGQQKDEALWQQFHEASEQAFAPCKQFFEQQAAAREKNLSSRQEMVAQLQQYLDSYDWRNADWPSVEKTLKVARQEWQLYWPVPRKAGGDLQESFEALMEQLFAKITAEYDNNKSAKQQLIEAARALSESSDTRAAIESAKKMQAQWKAIGKSWYKEDQQLWQDFRQHCDAVFARRSQEMDAVNQQRQAMQEQAELLSAKLENILALDLTELNAAKADIAAIKTEFFSLDLPRESAVALSAKLNTILTDIAEKIDQERNKAEAKSWQDMFAAADALREFELAVIAKKSDTELSVAKESLAALIANTPRWPTGSSAVIQQRLANAEHITAQDQINNTELLRTLTIRSEILAGKDSPEADKTLRMNYQVQQMQQAFGSRDSSFEPLVLEWITLGGIQGDVYVGLLNRFDAARNSGAKK